MRTTTAIGLLLLMFLPACAVADDEKPDPLEALKKAAKENWDRLDAGPMVTAETTHFLIVAPRALEGKLKEHGELLEKQLDQAIKTLYKEKDKPLKNRVTVYLLDKPEQIDAYIRRVEKLRPRGQDRGTFNPDDDKLRVAAAPPSAAGEPAVEVQAAMEVASMLLQRRAANSTILPYWLLHGFGRGTFYRAMPNHALTRSDRAAAVRFVNTRKRTAMDIWNGTIEGEEATVLDAHLADFLAYGPGRMKFLSLLEAFRPGENEEKKTMEQAMMTADLKADIVSRTFRTWITRPN